MVLAVVGLQDHEPLVSGKGGFDQLNPRPQRFRGFPLLPLQRVRPAVQRRDQQRHRQAQQQEGGSRAACQPQGDGKKPVQRQLDGPEDQLTQCFRHRFLPPCPRCGFYHTPGEKSIAGCSYFFTRSY